MGASDWDAAGGRIESQPLCGCLLLRLKPFLDITTTWMNDDLHRYPGFLRCDHTVGPPAQPVTANTI